MVPNVLGLSLPPPYSPRRGERAALSGELVGGSDLLLPTQHVLELHVCRILLVCSCEWTPFLPENRGSQWAEEGGEQRSLATHGSSGIGCVMGGLYTKASFTTQWANWRYPYEYRGNHGPRAWVRKPDCPTPNLEPCSPSYSPPRSSQYHAISHFHKEADETKWSCLTTGTTIGVRWKGILIALRHCVAGTC